MIEHGSGSADERDLRAGDSERPHSALMVMTSRAERAEGEVGRLREKLAQMTKNNSMAADDRDEAKALCRGRDRVIAQLLRGARELPDFSDEKGPEGCGGPDDSHLLNSEISYFAQDYGVVAKLGPETLSWLSFTVAAGHEGGFGQRLWRMVLEEWLRSARSEVKSTAAQATRGS